MVRALDLEAMNKRMNIKTHMQISKLSINILHYVNCM